MPSLSYLFEKVVLVICTSLLIFQIYLSWKTFIQEDYVETKSEEKLYNVDLPMIMICAKNPFIDRTDLIGWNSNGKFVGWAKENTSVQEILRSRIRVKKLYGSGQLCLYSG